MQSSILGSGEETSAGKATGGDHAVNGEEGTGKRTDGKIELDYFENYNKLGFSFQTWKKWMVLSVIFAVQISMNLNASIYGNAITRIAGEFDLSLQGARVGQMIFLVAYAFGCELWAPWSEEFGRRPVLQLSLFFVNLWQIPCALAPNYATIVVSRFLGGLSSAGGSVTLGMVADMWEPETHGYAVNFIVFSSVGGSVVGPIAGGYIQEYLSWHWVFWIQLIVGVAVQAVHFFAVPETRSSVLLTNEAKRRRKMGDANVYSADELKENRMAFKEVVTIWIRPFHMFACEPIVLFLSLLSGFSDALIFTFLSSFGLVFSQWGLDSIQLGLAFIPIAISYFVAFASFLPVIRRDHNIRARNPDGLQPESRLWWLLYCAPFLFLGLIGFAFTSQGPPNMHWAVPLFFSGLIGFANYAIYMATVDYMMAAYGPYSASATGGNGMARDFLAGVAAMYSVPLYENLSATSPLLYGSLLLAGLAFLVTIPIYVFYWKGPAIRARSKFAVRLASNRAAAGQGAGAGDKGDVELTEVGERV